MQRRPFLTTALAVVAGGAGCLGSDNADDADGANNTDNQSGTGGGDVDEAAELLVENAADLEALADPDQIRVRGQGDVDLDEIRARLDSAEIELSGVDTARAESLRTVAEFQRRLVDNHEASIEFVDTFGAAVQAVTTPGDLSLDGAEEYADDASAGFQTASDLLADLQSLRADLRSAHNRLDGGLDESALAYDGDLAAYVRYSQTQLENLSLFLGAYRQFFLGSADIFRGRTAFEEQRWADATDRFTAAQQSFQEATDRLDRLDVDTIQPINAEVVNEPAAPLVVTQFSLRIDQYLDIVSLHLDAAETANESGLASAEDTYDEATSQLRRSFGDA